MWFKRDRYWKGQEEQRTCMEIIQSQSAKGNLSLTSGHDVKVAKKSAKSVEQQVERV